MNFFKNCIEVLKIYFLNHNVTIFSTLTIVFVIFIQFIKTILKKYISSNLNIDYIFNEHIISYIIYLSMILISIIFYKTLKKINVKNKFLNILSRCWWLFILKIFWNILYTIIIGFDNLPNENLSISPTIILLLTWFTILIFSSYILSRSIENQTFSIFSYKSIYEFTQYFFKSFWKYIVLSLFLIFIVTAVIIVYAKIFSFINNSLRPLVNFFELKLFFEDILNNNISKIVYAHLIALASFLDYINYKKYNN